VNQPEHDVPGLPRGASSRGFWRAGVLLLAGLTVTGVAARFTKSEGDAAEKREFDVVCNEIQTKIVDRLSAHEQILRSGAAFYEHTAGINRQQWKHFTERQQVEQQLPGIQGIGFALLIPRQALAQHVQEIRAEGFPAYGVRPEGEREVYSSIIYLEPFTNRNLRAFGYDMLSEPVRRAAMERARDQGTVALSGKVILVQETDEDVQAGTLMYVPVYRTDMPGETVVQRRAALVGWVYSPYRMNDLMRGIMGGWDLASDRRIHLKVFDGEQATTETLLYDSQPVEDQQMESASRLTSQSSFVSAGRQWTLQFTRSGSHAATRDFSKVWLVVFGGTSISLLLSGLFFTLLNTRFKAWQMARQLTTDLRQSEEKYRVVFNNEIYAICIFDLETQRLLDVNDAYARLYGYRREDILAGMTIHDFTAEHQSSDTAAGQAIREGTVFIPLRYHRRKDGTVFPVEIVGGPSTWQGKQVVFALMHDISNRQRMEVALRDSEEKYRTVADFTYDWEAWRAPDGTYQYVSPSCERISGHPAAEFMADPEVMIRITHPDDQARVAEHYHAAVSEACRDSFELDFRILIPGGETRWISHSCTVVYGEDGRWLGRRESNRDITERKRAEGEREQLEGVARQLQKSESLGRMAGAIAHHFNNQLQVVAGYLEMTLCELPEGLNVQENLDEALRATRRASEVSSMMLTYLGQTITTREPLDLAEVCRRTLPVLQAAAPKNVVLEFAARSPGPIVRASANQIQQVLTNLVTNGWEACGAGPGTIHLSVTTVASSEIPRSRRFPITWQTRSAACACLEVADTGCGIADEDIEKLFDPFFSRKFTGRGMGLPVVLGIVRAHEGAIAVESEPGSGSIFRVYIALSAEALPL
jgi:PAS domain S-box-containing protein